MANKHKLPKINLNSDRGAVEDVVETPEVVKPEEVKESELNCPTCKGLGLVGNLEIAGQHSVCSQCNGSGRIN